MTCISPEILTAAKGLSHGGAAFVLVGGLLMWGLGWRWHRFWVVFGITFVAGILGLTAGKAAGGQVLIAGVLLAVAAGVLALELSRILAFVTGGTAAWVAIQAIFPNGQEIWAAFLTGGLVGVLLYRLWMMLVTSVIGVLFAGHAGLVLAESLRKFDAAGWAGKHPGALNGIVAVAAVLGVLIQAWTSPRRNPEESEKHEEHRGHPDFPHHSSHGHGHRDSHGHGHRDSHSHPTGLPPGHGAFPHPPRPASLLGRLFRLG